MAESKTKAIKEAPKEKPVKSNLALAMAEINKKHGDGSIIKGRSLIANVKAWPTNVATLDIALGCGGLPEGRIIEIYGPESAGKTTLALTCIAAAQSQGKVAAFVDVEHALDPEWATRLGVNMDALLLSQPDTAESALDIVEMLAKTGEVGIVVLDSVAALTPKAELDGEVGDSHIGLQARLMSQAMRKLKSAASNTGCVVIFINQIREKIGVMFGSNETTPGGRALKYYASVRMEVKRDGMAIKKGEVGVGNPTKVKIVKNKVGPPFVFATFNIMFGSAGHAPGIDKMESLMSVALATKGVFEQSGAWYTFGDKKLLGKDQWKEYVAAHPEMFPAIREKTYSVALKSGRAAPALLDMTDQEILEAGQDEQDDPDAVEEAVAAQPVSDPAEALGRDDD